MKPSLACVVHPPPPQVRPRHRPRCQRGPPLLLLLSLASLSDSTEVLLELMPSSSVFSSTLIAGGVHSTTSPLGASFAVSGGFTGAADAALGSAAALPASAVNPNQQGRFSTGEYNTLKTSRLGHFNIIMLPETFQHSLNCCLAILTLRVRTAFALADASRGFDPV